MIGAHFSDGAHCASVIASLDRIEPLVRSSVQDEPGVLFSVGSEKERTGAARNTIVAMRAREEVSILHNSEPRPSLTEEIVKF